MKNILRYRNGKNNSHGNNNVELCVREGMLRNMGKADAIRPTREQSVR